MKEEQFKAKLDIAEKRHIIMNNTDKIIELICSEYGISPDEFLSSFTYGNLPEARKLLCLALDTSGMKNKDIFIITGFSPGRISMTVNAGKELIASNQYFKQKHDYLVNTLNSRKIIA